MKGALQRLVKLDSEFQLDRSRVADAETQKARRMRPSFVAAAFSTLLTQRK